MNKLGGAMTRHPAHLTEEQVAAGQAAGGGLAGNPASPILQLSNYFLDPEGSTQSTQYRNFRTEVETLLRQRMRA